MAVSDLLLETGRWLMVAVFGVPTLMFIGLILQMIWTDAIKPRLIPAEDIERATDDLIASSADPEREAFARQERAWYDSDGAEQDLLVSGPESRQAASSCRIYEGCSSGAVLRGWGCEAPTLSRSPG